MLWLWISIYIVIGAVSAFIYAGKYNNPKERMLNGLPINMNKWEIIFIFLLWPIPVLISLMSKIL